MGMNPGQSRGDRCLVMVDGTRNSNKRYDIVVNGDGTFTAYYGRIRDASGHPSQRCTYPMSKYDSILRSKLRKGYKDVTEYNAAFSQADSGDSMSDLCDRIGEPRVASLMRELLSFSHAAVAASYKVGADAVTQRAIDDARARLALMRQASGVEDFNRSLIELLTIIPRRIGRVQDALASDPGDFGRILSKETDLLDVLEGQARLARQRREAEADEAETAGDILEMLGIQVFVATDEQVEHVMGHLGKNLHGKVAGIYRVRNLSTEARFDRWLEEHGSPRVRELWHGSRNENWVSILQNGLVLNPNAQVTGKMFGSGEYFAPSPSKSFNYTSYRGSYWAGGSSDTGIMGLYAVAYGKPYVVHDNSGFGWGFGWEDLQRVAPSKSCVHAKAGKVLRNDEIIFYREEQTTINYLVEFKGGQASHRLGR